MEQSEYVIELIQLIEKIYNQGELEPFINIAQIQNRILIYLSSHNNCHPSEIGDNLRISRPAVTSYLKSLEEENLLVREMNPQNRREIYVSLTDKGRTEISVIIQQMTGLFTDWLTILGDEAPHLFNILRLSADEKNIGDRFKNYQYSDLNKKR